MKDMTEEEAQYWSDYFMENPPKTDPTKPGIFARRKANRFFGMDNLTVNYLLTKSMETHKSPEEIIGDLVRKEIAVTAGVCGN
jgi:hypothetical protein